jgi:hypothetical protein
MAEQDVTSSTDSDTSLSGSSPLDRSALLLAHLVPCNRPARLAILKAREQGSTYHSNFITEIEYHGCLNTPCFELALGGLPEQSVGWRIGRGCNESENQGVDLLLLTDDDGIASVHASFGWTIHKPGLLLIILNKQHMTCTINGREFSFGDQNIPLENTILIGDCAFTLLFESRTCAAENFFQTELRNHVLRLIELRDGEVDENATRTVVPETLKRCRSTDHRKGLQEMVEDGVNARSRKRANLGL